MKKTSILSIMTILISIVSYSQLASLDDNLIVHYRFDGNTLDSSNNEFNTTSNATLTEDRFGNSNSAYSFNGVNEYIDLPNLEEFKPELPITVSFWVNFEDLNVTKTFVFTNDFTENLNTGINLSLTSANPNIAIAYGDGGSPSSSSRRTKVGTTNLSVNTWYLVVLIYLGPTDMKIYLNEYNSEELLCIDDGGTYSGSGSSLFYSNNPGTIGRNDVDTNNDPYYFEGKIDEFRMWNRELTIEEIESLCQFENSLSINEPLITMEKIFYSSNDESLNFVNLNGKLIVYNFLGQKIMQQHIGDDKMKISELSKGLYVVKVINNEGKKFSYKFVK